MSWFELQAKQSAQAPMAQQSDANTGFSLNNNWSTSPLIRSMARYDNASDSVMPSTSFLDAGQYGQQSGSSNYAMPGYGAPSAMPSSNAKANPWAAFGYGGAYNANFAPSGGMPDPTATYGVPISAAVRNTMGEINSSMAQATQIKNDGLAAAAKAEQEQAAKEQQKTATTPATEPGAYIPNGDEHAPATVPSTTTPKGIQVNAEGKVIAPTTDVTIDKVPDTVVDPTTGKERAPTEAEKKILQEQIDAQKKAANFDAKALTKDKREAASKALEILSACGHDGKVQPSDFETAFESPEAKNDPEVKKALQFIRDNAKTLAGTCGDENEHLTYEEVNFIKGKLDKGAWKSLDQAKDFASERKLMVLIEENNRKEDGFTWGFGDSNLELDGGDGDDYKELKDAIGDDEYTKGKLEEMSKKFEDFQKATHYENNGEHDNWLNWTDGDELGDDGCKDLRKAVENGWSFQQILEKKNTDDQKDKSIENW